MSPRQRTHSPPTDAAGATRAPPLSFNRVVEARTHSDFPPLARRPRLPGQHRQVRRFGLGITRGQSWGIPERFHAWHPCSGCGRGPCRKGASASSPTHSHPGSGRRVSRHNGGMFGEQTPASEFRVRLGWGQHAVEAEAPRVAVVVVVDVLRFTTAVDAAVALGAHVHPYRWRDDGAAAFAPRRRGSPGRRRPGPGRADRCRHTVCGRW